MLCTLYTVLASVLASVLSVPCYMYGQYIIVCTTTIQYIDNIDSIPRGLYCIIVLSTPLFVQNNENTRVRATYLCSLCKNDA